MTPRGRVHFLSKISHQKTGKPELGLSQITRLSGEFSRETGTVKPAG
jgi:hypothetical protein